MTLQRETTDDAALSAHERAILDFESNWWHTANPKDDQIRDRFGLSTPRYYQQLHSLIDRPEALRAYPVLIKRLLRQRDARRDARSATRLAR